MVGPGEEYQTNGRALGFEDAKPGGAFIKIGVGVLRKADDSRYVNESMRAAIQGFGSSPQDYDIRIENRKVGAGARITGDRPLSSLALWSIRTALAIEPYITMSIAPGAEFSWKITYDYYTLK